jgi:outer membrane immunogenic protein
MMNRKMAFTNAVAAGALAVSFGTSASAADLSARSPAPVYGPWSGFYVGAHIGGVTSSETVNGVSTDPSGVAGGLQGGYNFKIAPLWLVGIEGELSWTNANGTSGNFKSGHNWYDTVDARVGYILPWRGWMLYGKAGAAWMNEDVSNHVVTDKLTRSGWNVGVGTEYMIAPQWSVKAEYNYLDFGTDNTRGFSADTKVNQFKAGVNYHFAPGTLFGRW